MNGNCQCPSCFQLHHRLHCQSRSCCGQMNSVLYMPVSVPRSCCGRDPCNNWQATMSTHSSGESNTDFSHSDVHSDGLPFYHNADPHPEREEASHCSLCGVRCASTDRPIYLQICPSIHHLHHVPQGLLLCNRLHSHECCQGHKQPQCREYPTCARSPNWSPMERYRRRFFNGENENPLSENSQSLLQRPDGDNAKTPRKLSSDSGRVTFSDSGESTFSECQIGDCATNTISAMHERSQRCTSYHRRNFSVRDTAFYGDAHTKCPMNTRETEGASNMTDENRLSPNWIAKQDCMAQEVFHENDEESIPSAANHGDPRPHRFSFVPQEEGKSQEKVNRKNQSIHCHSMVQSCGKIRGNRKTSSLAHLALSEDKGEKAGRVRSKSLLVNPGSSFYQPIETLVQTPTIDEFSSTENSFTEKDITTWTTATLVREIFGDRTSKDGLKCYCIASVTGQDLLAVTDAEKVKIKLYKTNGEMQISFGTPTWPRYGRGLASTNDGKHLVACHLTEVCVYTLDGKPVKRFAKEEFTACWGIACDKNDNYVITDPKSSSVFFLNSEGDIINQIGEDMRNKGPQSVSSASFKNIKKSPSWVSNLSIKALRSGRRRESKSFVRRKSASMRKVSNVSLSPLESLMPEANIPTARKHNSKVRLIAPRYVAVNSKNHVLVTDTKQRCLLVFRQNGTLIFSIGGGRMGCKQCNKCKDFARPEPKSPGMAPSLDDIAELESDVYNSVKDDFSQKSETSSEDVHSNVPPLNALAGFCGVGNHCMEKTPRTKVFGEIFRGNIGRNESVESECYKPGNDPGSIANRCKDLPSTDDVGSRLQGHFRDNGCESSKVDLRGAEKTSSRMKNIRKRMSISFTPGKLRRRWKKNLSDRDTTRSEMEAAHISTCHSLQSLNGSESNSDPLSSHVMSTSLNEGLDSLTIRQRNFSESALLKSSPNLAGLPGSYSKSEAASLGSPESTNDEGTEFSFLLNEYSIISSESNQGGDWDDFSEDENSERVACRRCHIEDPRGVCVDKNDNILLVDRARHRVTVFNPKGHFVRHILTQEHGLHEPMNVTILHNGTVAVTDSANSIKIFQFS